MPCTAPIMDPTTGVYECPGGYEIDCEACETARDLDADSRCEMEWEESHE